MADNQPTLFDSEIWKPVVGYEGYYEVSDHGRVRSLDRVDTAGRTKKGVIRKAVLSRDHMQLALYRDTKMKMKYVHRLVLEAFVGPCPEGMEACHNDGNPSNNHVNNLRWDTQSENMNDRVKHGSHHQAIKTHCPRGHVLAEPNLVVADLKRGGRTCLSCSRGRARVQNFPHLKPDQIGRAHV